MIMSVFKHDKLVWLCQYSTWQVSMIMSVFNMTS